MGIGSALLDFGDGGGRAMVIVAALAAAVLVYRAPQRLGPVISFIVFVPLLVGLFGQLSGQIAAAQSLATAGGNADPTALAMEVTQAQGCLLLGVLCTIVVGLEAVVVFSLRRRACGQG